jgi:hypothetical protein
MAGTKADGLESGTRRDEDEMQESESTPAQPSDLYLLDVWRLAHLIPRYSI